MGKFADVGCQILFDKDTVKVMYEGKIILTGHRCPHTGLWQIPLETSNMAHQANSITGTTKLSEMVKFSHAALYSPRVSTLLISLNKHYVKDFPGLTAKSLRHNDPRSTATAKGHLDQERANQQSTKTQPDTASEEQLHADTFPPELEQGKKTHACYVAIVTFEPTGQVHTDQTGPFPVTSTRGNKLVFTCYDYDSNLIHPVPIKNKEAATLLEAYKVVHTKLCKAGLRPKLHRLDNECSRILKEFMNEQEEDYQLAPPGIHRRNSAERAIRTFKNHFIAGLSSVDPKFPLNLWDRLVEQCYITLNLLRGSRMNPKLSAYAQIEGEFSFNRTPIAPPGTRVVVHEKPSNRGSWDAHGVDGWYIGPALESYRCFKTYIWSTKAERITDTLEWFPHYVNMPTSSDLELLVAATTDILNILKNPKKNSPLPPLTQLQSQQLQELTQILQTQSQAAQPDTVDQQPPPNHAAPTAPALRVPPTTRKTPAPVLRVPVTQPHVVTQPTQEEISIPEAAPVLQQVPPPPPPPEPVPPPPPLQDPQPVPPPPQQETFQYNGILGHRHAPKGSGSTYQVKVDWVGGTPTFVNVNDFTEHGHNPDAWESVAEYAEENNLLNTRSWKQFRNSIDGEANNAVHRKPHKPIRPHRYHRLHQAKQQLNKDCREWFQQCLANTVQELANKAVNPDTGILSEYHTLLKSTDGNHWEEATCDEIGRLAQGNPPDIEGTDTMHFIRFEQIPQGRKATYLRLVVADRPMKANPRRVRFTVGGDQVDYPFDTSTKVTDLATAKILLNSIISTPDARGMCADIKDFYLNNPMSRFEYMKIPVKCIPDKMMKLYNLEPLIHNGGVYVEIRKGMYGLPAAGRIASDKLIPILNAAGFHQSDQTPGLFKHATRPIAFCLCVDDFLVKYVGKEHADFFLTTLRQAHYKITVDWEAKEYCGLKLLWDYDNGTVDISMPGYVEKALQRFQHPTPDKPEDSPHEWTKPQYGVKTQMTKDPDTSPLLTKEGTTRLQQVIGTLLYYGRAVDSTMLVALGTLASQQSKGTDATMEALNKLLNYAATHPEAVVRYTKSGMILYIHSDASYLSESQARSRAGGYFYMGDTVPDDIATGPLPPLNGAIHIVSSILSNVMASATEAEVGALFHNAQDACQFRNTLDFLGHTQPPTPIQTDNKCAEGIANDTVKQKRSKAIDMRFWWLRCRANQSQLNIFWRKGSENRADYYTKHHPPSHHREMRGIYLHEKALSLIKFHD